MQYALKDSLKTKAQPFQKALCPQCGDEVIAKCGQIKIWHWAHKINDCDKWWESEGEWHLYWKKDIPVDKCEVTIGKHRADIITSENEVLELQNSPISMDEIRERESFYGNMVWLINAEVFRHNFNLDKREHYVVFKWKWPRKSFQAFTKPLYLDFGDEDLFRIKKIGFEGRWVRSKWGKYFTKKCSGWGKLITVTSFKQRFLNYKEVKCSQ